MIGNISDDGEAYVYESEEENSVDDDEDNPILQQLKALGFKPNDDCNKESEEITSAGTINEDEEEDTSKFVGSVIKLNERTESIDEEDEEDEELVGAEKWAVEAIKREQQESEEEEEEDEEVEDANDEEEVEDEEENEEEEEEEEEVEEIEIDGEMYYTTNKKNGIIYEYLSDEEVGDEVGHLEEGILFLS